MHILNMLGVLNMLGMLWKHMLSTFSSMNNLNMSPHVLRAENDVQTEHVGHAEFVLHAWHVLHAKHPVLEC